MALLLKWTSAPQLLLRTTQRRYSHSERKDASSSRACQLHFQDPWPRCPFPSPHEILGAKPGSPYSKKKFHQLVKLYHPDLEALNTNEKGVENLPRATRIERYRLVVEANEILSDPRKRLLYERDGLGWALSGQEPRYARRGPHGAAGFRRAGDWRSSPGAKTEKQVPIFASNVAVAIILLAMAMGGAVVQLERARKTHWDLKMRDGAMQAAISRDLQGMADRLEGKPRDERILEFLVRRELRNWTGRDSFLAGVDYEENICRH